MTRIDELMQIIRQLEADKLVLTRQLAAYQIRPPKQINGDYQPPPIPAAVQQDRTVGLESLQWR